MYRSIHLIIAMLVGICSVSGQSAEVSDLLKSNIESRTKNGDIVGIVIGTINGDQTSYFKSGVRSLKTNDPVGEHAIFEIGSITKTFTGLLLADKVVQGQMKLDDDIQKYLPEGITAPMRGGQSIKLFHLLNHTSGLPGQPTNFDPADFTNPYKDYTRDMLYQSIDKYTLLRDIGSQYEYSNYAVGLLGQILADQSDQTYEKLLREVITNQLGMKHTGIQQIEGPHAIGHMNAKEVSNWDFDALAGAGAIRSTASDMMRYLSTNMGITESKLYPAMQLAHKNSGAEDNNPIVGLGWHTLKYDNKEIIWHNGGTGGYTSFMGWIKGTEKGVVVLNNSTENVDDIGIHVLVPSFPLKQIKKTVIVEDAILESYVGQYALAPSFILTVTKKGSQLSVQATGQGAFEVFPKSKTTFFYKAVEAELVFKKNQNGKIESVTLFQGGQEIVGKRVE